LVRQVLALQRQAQELVLKILVLVLRLLAQVQVLVQSFVLVDLLVQD
jgi:hypothetical protein